MEENSNTEIKATLTSDESSEVVKVVISKKEKFIKV